MPRPRDISGRAAGTEKRGVPAMLRAAFFVLILAACGAAAAAFWHAQQPTVYSAKVRLAYDPSVLAEPGRALDDGLLALARLRLAYLESDAVLQQIDADPAQLRRNIGIEAQQRGLVADLVVSGGAAEAVAQQANAIADAFAAHEKTAMETAQARRLAQLRERAARISARLDAARQAAAAQDEAATVTTVPQPVSANDQPGAGLEAEIRQLNAAADDPRADLSSLPESVRILGERRDAAAADFNLVARTYGPRHPRWIEANRRQVAARDAFAAEIRRVGGLRQRSLDALRQQQATAAEQVVPSVPPVEPSAVAASEPALLTLEAERNAVDEDIAAVEEAANLTPVEILARAAVPVRADGAGASEIALLGAAGGGAIGLALLLIWALVRLATRDEQPYAVVLQDVPYTPLTPSGTLELSHRSAEEDAAEAVETAVVESSAAEPVQEQANEEPVEVVQAEEAQPLPVDEVESEPPLEDKVRELAEAVNQATQSFSGEPAIPEESLTDDPPGEDAILARRERLRRELRAMAARRDAERSNGGKHVRILSAEEVQRRHDDG